MKNILALIFLFISTAGFSQEINILANSQGYYFEVGLTEEEKEEIKEEQSEVIKEQEDKIKTLTVKLESLEDFIKNNNGLINQIESINTKATAEDWDGELTQGEQNTLEKVGVVKAGKNPRRVTVAGLKKQIKDSEAAIVEAKRIISDL